MMSLSHYVEDMRWVVAVSTEQNMFCFTSWYSELMGIPNHAVEDFATGGS